MLVAACGGGDGSAEDAPAESEPPPEMVATPLDVQALYDTSSWTFEKVGTQVRAQTDLDMDDENEAGINVGENVCQLTLYSVDGAESVVVTGLNGREGCRRWDSG
jgi:hypothetical protein